MDILEELKEMLETRSSFLALQQETVDNLTRRHEITLILVTIEKLEQLKLIEKLEKLKI